MEDILEKFKNGALAKSEGEAALQRDAAHHIETYRKRGWVSMTPDYWTSLTDKGAKEGRDPQVDYYIGVFNWLVGRTKST